MYRYHAKYFLPILILSFYGIQAFGQTSTVSDPLSTRENAPYSRFGIGEMWDGDNTLLRGMGHISSAYESPTAVNADNPASYSFLALTTYEVGAEASIRTLASSDQSYTTGTATLSYLNIGIPVGKNAGMCIGVRPYTHIYYNFADTTNTALGNNTVNSLIGTGGVTYAYVGAAGKIKNFSVGFNFGYMFGNINTSNNIYNSDTTSAFNSEFIQNTKIGGIYYKLGAIYEGKLTDKIGLRVGGTFTMQQNLNAWRDEYWISTHDYPDTVVSDTAYTAAEKKGTIVMPMSYSFGVQVFNTNKWMVGLDYSGAQWSQFRNFGLTDSVTNSYKISLGGQYTPDINALHNYWSHVTYRLGFYYGADYVDVRNTQLKYYAVTLGASLPFKRSTDQIHLALDLGQMGTQTNGLVQQTYVRFTLGLSMNQQWFVKRKYD